MLRMASEERLTNTLFTVLTMVTVPEIVSPVVIEDVLIEVEVAPQLTKSVLFATMPSYPMPWLVTEELIDLAARGLNGLDMGMATNSRAGVLIMKVTMKKLPKTKTRGFSAVEGNAVRETICSPVVESDI